MNVIYLTLIISTLVAVGFFVVFIFSLKKGQYDDTYTPSVRMLFDDELVKEDADEDDSEFTSKEKNPNNSNIQSTKKSET